MKKSCPTGWWVGSTLLCLLWTLPPPVTAQEEDGIHIAGIYDTNGYPWGRDIFDFTFQQMREGLFANQVFIDQTNLDYTVADANCDETTAVRAYWGLRTQQNNNGGRPLHGIVGARCSGPSVSLARISGLEGVPQVSPSSTSSSLSNKDEFPYFSRLVAPGDARGEVGALVATLRAMGWERVLLLSTDTQFAKDTANDFRKLWQRDNNDASGRWTGDVPDYNIIQTDRTTDTIVEESAIQILKDASTKDGTINARVIVLMAHNQHAFPILKLASELNYQKADTIWAGLTSWIGRRPPEGFEDLSWLPKYAGYIGPGAFRSKSVQHEKYLKALQRDRGGAQAWPALPAFASEMVDAIVALCAALSAVPTNQRRNGDAVVAALRQLDFQGVSGRVRFTPEGDRADPQFSILNLGNDTSNLIWTEVGTTGIQVGSAAVRLQDVCFAQLGCGLDTPPSDRYPVPRDKLAGWAVAIIVILILSFVGVAIKYWRSRKSKKGIKAELDAFKDSVVGMRTATTLYLPTMVVTVHNNDDDDGSDVEKAMGPTTCKVTWCWKESLQAMSLHDADVIVGDPANGWIKYDSKSNAALEAAYQAQGSKGEFSPLLGYTVNFDEWTQTKMATGFVRDVERHVHSSGSSTPPKHADFQNAMEGEALPSDISDEPQMVLVKGDVVQISNQRADGWAFGTKLYHEDETVARELVVYLSSQNAGDEDEANVFADTGWFQLDATRVPSADDLAALQKNVGDTGALEAPKEWDPIIDPSVVQQHRLQKGSPEYDAVVTPFLTTLQNRSVQIGKVERIQNLAMWQSYVVRRQTICYRETSSAGDSVDALATQKALDRFERKWLWHGTNVEVMDKILQQGFNRSFCGKNATMYGKGVYFARDASYSSYKTYAVPDAKGYQYVMACRVVVGEYCRGKMDALTPDIRDPKSHSLYDSTVGLLSGDDMSDPSIYVTYHDAQAYPEYLIKFKQS